MCRVLFVDGCGVKVSEKWLKYSEFSCDQRQRRRMTSYFRKICLSASRRTGLCTEKSENRNKSFASVKFSNEQMMDSGYNAVSYTKVYVETVETNKVKDLISINC